MNPLLSVENLQVHFQTPQGILQAVRGVDFTLERGETLGIVGESGSGKSVSSIALLHLLPGNTAYREGRILFEGNNPEEMDPETLRKYRGGSVGMIFQEPGRSFDPIYTVGKTLMETLRNRHPDKKEMSDDQIRLRAIELLEEVKVPDAAERMNHYPHQFSGGLLQRIMIAAALAPNPDILVADEPTTALDVTIQAQIISLLLELQKKRNLAILFISHDLALISSIADRIAVMYSGLIVEEGPASEVLHKPRHPYTRALMEAVPRLGRNYRQGLVEAIPGSVPDPHNPPPGCPFTSRCFLAKKRGTEACIAKIPEMQVEENVQFRCIYGGVK